MKLFFLSLLSFLIIENTYSQLKSSLTLSSGLFTTPSYGLNKKAYSNVIPDIYYKLAFQSSINKNWNIEMGCLIGNQRYFDNLFHTNISKGDPFIDYIRTDGTNAEVENVSTKLSIGYNLYQNSYFISSIGTGVAINFINYIFQYKIPRAANSIEYQRRTSGYWTISFPLEFHFEFKLSKSFYLRIEAATFVEPDYPLLVNHAGIGIKYIFK